MTLHNAYGDVTIKERPKRIAADRLSHGILRAILHRGLAIDLYRSGTHRNHLTPFARRPSHGAYSMTKARQRPSRGISAPYY